MTTAARRLLCMTAHPDDESGAFGGALMLARQQGFETTLVCLTDGQAAHFREGADDSEALGQKRRAELKAACEVLDITRHEVLDYPDGQLAHEKFYELVGDVVARIRRWRPQVVLTFGGDGGVNLHRDHIIVSMATTAAFHWAGRPEFFPEQIGVAFAGKRLKPHAPQKLYYSSTPFVSVRARPELNGSPTVPWSLSLELGPLGERKFQAFLQHETQRGVIARVGESIREHFERERYLLAAAPGLLHITDDAGLFEGLHED
uniref:PIG-L family deacetylase n=1 Tax=Acidobacterium capsulatum TaxID=33075 RepID=A0A7V4XSJ8_9BACT